MARLWMWVVTATLVVVLTSAKPVEEEEEEAPDAEVTLQELDLEVEADATVEDKLDAESKGNLLGIQKNPLQDTFIWTATTILTTLVVTAWIAVVGLLKDLKEEGKEKWERSLAPNSWLERSDAFYALAYLMGDYGCLNRLACEDSARAPEILSASKKVLVGAKILKPLLGSSMDKFERVVHGFQDAMKYRKDGGNCSAMYACSAMPKL